MNKEILDKIQALFFTRLEDKTGWGKNDIKQLYIECQLEILKQYIN
jgi:hypothetical protein